MTAARTASSLPPAARGRVGEQVGPVGVVLDQGAEQGDDGVGLGPAGRAQVHVVVVEAAELGEGVGDRLDHADAAGLGGGGDHRPDERAELSRAARAAPLGAPRPAACRR